MSRTRRKSAELDDEDVVARSVQAVVEKVLKLDQCGVVRFLPVIQLLECITEAHEQVREEGTCETTDQSAEGFKIA